MAAKKPKQLFCYYNGKVINMSSSTYGADPRRRFNIAAMRIVDNGAQGYVLEGDKLFFVGKNSRVSKPVTDADERKRVVEEINEILLQASRPDYAGG